MGHATVFNDLLFGALNAASPVPQQAEELIGGQPKIRSVPDAGTFSEVSRPARSLGVNPNFAPTVLIVSALSFMICPHSLRTPAELHRRENLTLGGQRLVSIDSIIPIAC